MLRKPLDRQYVKRLFVAEEIITNVGVSRKLYYQECYGSNRHEETTVTSIEPMEVDSSSNNVSSSCTTEDFSQYKPRRRLKRSDCGKVVETNSYIKSTAAPRVSLFSKLLLFLIFIFTLGIISLMINGDQYFGINRSTQFAYLKSDLEANVLNQLDALTVITHSIDDVNLHMHESKIVAFIGTTGVGKTFTANIIKRHFVPNHIHEISKENLNNKVEQEKVLNNLDICCCNLILIDNLRASDLDNIVKFILKLPIASHSLIIIPIFNVHDTTDGIRYTVNKKDFNAIRTRIDALNINFEMAVFYEPKQYVVEGWLREKLRKKGIKQHTHDILIKNLLEKNYLKNNGFKGLDAKLAIIEDQ